MRRNARGFTLIEIMVVIAIIAGLIGTVAIIVPQMQEKQRRFTCQDRQRQLAGLFVSDMAERPGKPKYEGQALWLSWRLGSKKIREGEEQVLVCPGDYGITAPDSPTQKEKYNQVDLNNPPSDLCSFTSRDFSTYPLSNEATKVQIIGSDRNGPDGRTMHHNDGLVCAFDDGHAEFMDREKLGISPGDPIVVGPESSHEMLKQVIYTKSAK